MDIERIFAELTEGYKEVPEHWISVTSLRPIQQKDGFLLWAKHWATEIYGFVPDPQEHSTLDFLGKMGSAFEARVVQEFFPEAVQVLQHDHECRTAAALKKSLKALNSDALVLTKVALWGGPDVKLYGTADIVARAGLLRATFKDIVLDDPDDTWIIVDCKFSARLLENQHKMDLAINSTQVRAYSYMLSRMLEGKIASKAFLITKDTPFSPLSVRVNHEQGAPLDPAIASLRDQAVNLKINGWRYRPWRGDPEVAINYSNSKSEPWAGLKGQFKELMQPLEILPGIGKAKADAMRAAGHVDLKTMLAGDIDTLDLRAVHGIGDATDKKIKAALRANKTGKPSAVPVEIVPAKVDREVFLDFEFFPGIHCPVDDPSIPFPECLQGVPMIFMAGVGVEDKQGAFEFRRFLAKREDHESQKVLLMEMLAYLEELGVFDPHQSSAVYIWSGAEVSRCKEAVARHGTDLDRLNALPFVDLQRVFSKNNIALPGGCWGYGLKPVSRAINKISPDHFVAYPPELSEAAVAMCMGWAAYEEPDSETSAALFSTIESYLLVDCKAMWQALRWLRAAATDGPGPSKPVSKRPPSRPRRKATSWYTRLIAADCPEPEYDGWYRRSLN
ncbi:MAG: hypothetical protein JWL77_2139 [Chthonomonadaceae bacterium]|nr:hypothetical protein [Chthonomonadaceae bacterium]